MSVRGDKVRAKVTRAQQHIQAFQLAWSVFHESKPYEVSIKENPDGGNPIYYLSRVDPVPDAMTAIASDIVQNLRSALDNVAYQLVVDGCGGARPDWKVYFPISKSATDYKATRRGGIKGVRQEVIDAIDATEPYKGGKGHVFWQIQQISNPDKHEIMLDAAGYFRSVDVGVDMQHAFRQIPGFEHFVVPPLFLNPANRKMPLKVGDILFVGPAEPEVAKNRQFRIDIAVHAPGVIEPEPAPETFKNMANVVGHVVGELSRFLR